MTPQPGDFACVHVKGDVGALISIGEWLNGNSFSMYDHACIYVGMPDSNGPHGYVMGAQPDGARLDPLRPEQFTGTDRNWVWSTGKILLSPAQRDSIVNYAVACKGIGYSWADYFALAAHRLHIPIPGLRGYIASSKSMICSMLIDWTYAQAGVHLFNGVWQGYVTPAMLASLIGG